MEGIGDHEAKSDLCRENNHAGTLMKKGLELKYLSGLLKGIYHCCIVFFKCWLFFKKAILMKVI